MSVALHFGGSIEQYVNTFLIVETIDVEDNGPVKRQVKALEHLFIAFPRCVLLQINAIGDNAGWCTQTMII